MEFENCSVARRAANWLFNYRNISALRNGRCVAFAKRMKLAEIVGNSKPGANEAGRRLFSPQRGFYLLLGVRGQRRVRDLTYFVRKLT